MSSLLSKLMGRSEDLKAVFERGATILDVRTPEEFRGGHVAGAVNIPLNRLESRISELKGKNKPVITCCRSGARSAAAKSTLSAAGIEAYNGGPWEVLERRIR